MLYEVEPGSGIYETRPNIKNLFGFTVLEAPSNDDLEALRNNELLDREGEPEWWIQSIIDQFSWRYACVCGQWEGESHDEILCEEIIRELT